MKLKRLAVYNFRCHTQQTVDFLDNTTILVGKNGVGKTSLLEAIYIALQGSSFKGSDQDILKIQQDWWRVDLELADQTIRSVSFDNSKTTQKKQFVIDSKKSARLSSKHKYPVVLFEPEDLRLLNGSPVRRRQFIDKLILQINPQFNIVLRRYERALRQRNSLLKRSDLKNEDLFAWNIILAENGAQIINNRLALIDKINQKINQKYQQIAKTDDQIIINYSFAPAKNVVQQLISQLEKQFFYDKTVKFTSVGPHRHDLIFNFNNFLANKAASRGETRTIVLALKNIEIELIEALTDKKPIVLLDDVFSDLDETRKKGLQIKENQSVISSTSYGEYPLSGSSPNSNSLYITS